jgi:hypothetical protein
MCCTTSIAILNLSEQKVSAEKNQDIYEFFRIGCLETIAYGFNNVCMNGIIELTSLE